MRNSSELITTAPSMSPNFTRGRRKSSGRRSLPMMRTSPPGRAAAGWTAVICGLPLTFFLLIRRSEIPMDFISLTVRARQTLLQEAKVQRDLHASQGVKTGPHVVKHNAHAFAKLFEVAKRRRLYDIEPAKKYKAQQQRFPRHCCADEGNELACHFVNYNKLRIFECCAATDSRSSGYPDRDREPCEKARHYGLPLWIEPASEQPPE